MRDLFNRIVCRDDASSTVLRQQPLDRFQSHNPMQKRIAAQSWLETGKAPADRRDDSFDIVQPQGRIEELSM
jgi:hypothetical protein